MSASPSEVSSPRMQALARLPVFFALAGKRVVVAGGNAAAAWKIELMSAAGAQVDVYAAQASDDVIAAAQADSVALHGRAIEPADFAGAALAIGAFEDEAAAADFATRARAAGVTVNVVDRPALSDFSFGTIVNRSPLVVGISTDGAAPVFAQAIRAKIEAMIPLGFARWAEAARRWRGAVKTSGLSFGGRRRFWQLFTGEAVAHPDRAPETQDFDALMDAAHHEGDRVDHGSVTLVGAGPGDPELLTLRAVRALQSADVILFDQLVSPGVLDFARREAKRMLVGKAGYGPACKQDEINRLMIALARAGKRVVRLKGGDPLIFGRGGEELAACRAAGLAVEVVPGITAAQGAASRLGVSLTHRSTARRLQYVTGHGSDGQLPRDIDWKSIADPVATTVVYMPARTFADLARVGIANGLDPATPAVAIVKATRPDEIVAAAPIGDLPGRLTELPPGPVLVMIGRVFSDIEAVMPRESAASGTSQHLEGGAKSIPYVP
ncbi:MAG TPA: siroheme synthase CysG [Xanthobacteraceae bacterium]|jgi:uroporphyrin-III C-methyltransferase/precorrin-2 dehydrogenase/sirohydrochlorin ferrochelatase